MRAQGLLFPRLLCMLALLLVGQPGISIRAWSRSTPLMAAPSAPHPGQDSLPERNILLSQKSLASGLAASAAGGTQTGYLSLSAGAFRASSEFYDYRNYGRWLVNVTGTAGYGFYYAPVHLPQGGVVTRFTFYFKDNAVQDGLAVLVRFSHTGAIGPDMAGLYSSGSYPSPGYGSASTTTINNATIDNSQYAYYVLLRLPDSSLDPNDPSVLACGVTLEYTYTPAATNPGYFSIPAASFTPFLDGNLYVNMGNNLFHKWSPGGGSANGWYLARVQLPDHATVTKFSIYYQLNSTIPGVVRLQRSHLGYGDFQEMTALWSGTGSPGDTSQSTTTINNGLIDNDEYSYWVVADLPAWANANSIVAPYQAVIEYAQPTVYDSSIYHSIPAAAFVPHQNGYDFENHARYLAHMHSPGAGNDNGYYYAPVELPHGARVSQVKFYWYDNSWYAATAILHRDNHAGTSYNLATLTSGNGAPTFFGESEVFSGHIIDNQKYAYWVVWELPAVGSSPVPAAGDALGCGMVLETTYPLFLPFVRR